MKVVEIGGANYRKKTKKITPDNPEAKEFIVTFKGIKICVEEILVSVDDEGNLLKF